MLLPKTISSSVERIFIFSLFALNAIVLVLIAATVSAWTTNDTPRYLELADNLANGYFGLMTSHGFEIEGVRSFGYPFFILVCRILPGDIVFNVVIVQGILYLISVFLVWKIVKHNLGTEVSYVFLILLLFILLSHINRAFFRLKQFAFFCFRWRRLF